MEPLFHIETDQVSLKWTPLRAKHAEAKPGGMLRLRALRAGVVFGPATMRQGVPPGVSGDAANLAGPCLFEQVDYSIYAQTRATAKHVEIRHVDPVIREQLKFEDGGRVAHGVINFGSQIGRSEFLVLVDGKPEFAFELEVSCTASCSSSSALCSSSVNHSSNPNIPGPAL